MKTLLATAAAATAFATLPAPALAGDRWERDERRAYAQGFRDGQRSDHRGWHRGPAAWQPYQNGSRWDDRRWNDAAWRDSGWSSGTVYRGAQVRGNDRYWWGPNGQVYCRRSDGTTGVIVGAIAGGTLGNMVAAQGDKRLGSVIGGTLGAILGREIDRGNARCR
ncbi:MAG: glycine zipper 2TM domain-containing protein [Sphingomonadaceae bacterium]